MSSTYPFRVDLDTLPPQPDEIRRALAEALADPDPQPDPWWQAGIEENLEE